MERTPPVWRQRFGTDNYYLMHGAARFTTAELVGLNRKLLDVDVALKSTRLEPLHLFSRFLAQACRQGRRQS